MGCSKCSVSIGVGMPYYQWSCGHLLAESCYGPQLFTEVGLKCPLCSSMMTRRMYEQWCLRGFIQHYLARSGFRFPALNTAPILPQYTNHPVLLDLSRFAPVQPSQFCKKKVLAKKPDSV